jgi:pyruvate/2-oxoglutarate dehydrogenase complex dihydrolipoamide dehydrogenase (E3) component
MGNMTLSQAASSESHLATRNARAGRHDQVDERVVPYLIGITPPVATVGLTEEQARDARYDVGTHVQTYRDVCPAGNVAGEPAGLFKIVLDKTSAALLGADALGSGSPELVQRVAFALRANLTLRETGASPFTYPGLSEVAWYALRPHPGDPM